MSLKVLRISNVMEYHSIGQSVVFGSIKERVPNTFSEPKCQISLLIMLTYYLSLKLLFFYERIMMYFRDNMIVTLQQTECKGSYENPNDFFQTYHQ